MKAHYENTISLPIRIYPVSIAMACLRQGSWQLEKLKVSEKPSSGRLVRGAYCAGRSTTRRRIRELSAASCPSNGPRQIRQIREGFRPHWRRQLGSTTLSSGLLPCIPLTSHSTNPSVLSLFMKKRTRTLLVPTIPASDFWLIEGITSAGLPSLPKRGSNMGSHDAEGQP